MRRTVLAAALALSQVALGCDSKNEAEPESAPPQNETASVTEPKTDESARRQQATPSTPTKKKPGEIPPPEDVAGPPKDAQKTESGLASKVLKPGDGDEHPGERDRVRVHYTGWTTDGKMFDSSVARGQPTEFGVKQVIPGWTEGLQLMTAGEKRRLWIPADLAYGKKPKRPGAPAGDLVFDVELLDIQKAPEPPEVPDDLTSPPKSAKVTKSGLRYRVLSEGEGESPGPEDVVQAHYTGWTTDGKMFDSSVVRDQPLVFRLDQVIPGWTEGVQLMKTGEKARFWIPAKLAYGEKPKRAGAPAGDLVFDVELLRIMPSPGRASSPR
jgi:peptidylprolyl isomerase